MAKPGSFASHTAQRGLTLVLGAALLGLGGCASVYLVDNQVQSFAKWPDSGSAKAPQPPQPPQNYRFERLPSQHEGTARQLQDALDALARTALAQRGWHLVDPDKPQNAHWTVQISANTLRLPRAPWDDPWRMQGGFWDGFPGRDYVVTGQGQIVWMPHFMPPQAPYYQREVALVVRQASSGQVVFETRAAHDGRWSGAPELWGAMIEAALRDFPLAPAGVRQINVEVPR
ncbi:DUF4136 domain-containing protein [Hydrogenophaga sp.]|uniref:DUF4136 domain-containing protein n=1 Tax=Hydrogenophaga sp. TaxID=1904254 RepID=UPI003569EF3E